jgi:hypothetical protein
MRKAIWSNSGIVLKNAESLQIEIARWGLQFLKDPPCKGPWVPFWLFWVFTAMSALSCKTHKPCPSSIAFNSQLWNARQGRKSPESMSTLLQEHITDSGSWMFLEDKSSFMTNSSVIPDDVNIENFFFLSRRSSNPPMRCAWQPHYLSFNSASRFSICNHFKLTSVIIQIQS